MAVRNLVLDVRSGCSDMLLLCVGFLGRRGPAFGFQIPEIDLLNSPQNKA